MKNKAPSKRRRTQAEIREIVSRYPQSRLTQVEFSRAEGISRSILTRRLRRERLGAGAAQRHRFVEMESIPGIGEGAQRAPYRVCLGAQVSVEIPPGFCGGEVTRLLWATAAAMRMS